MKKLFKKVSGAVVAASVLGSIALAGSPTFTATGSELAGAATAVNGYLVAGFGLVILFALFAFSRRGVGVAKGR